MRVPALLPLVLTCALLPAQDAGNGLVVQPDPENVVAAALLGDWTRDVELCRRLGNRHGKERLEFRDDATVLAGVSLPIAEKLREQRIYLAGRMVRGDQEHAFLLTTMHGNPTLVWFRERDGDPMGDVETCNVSLARAEAKAADLLFVGGDSVAGSFGAYRRVSAVVGKLEPAAAVTEMIRLLEAGRTVEFFETFVTEQDLEKMRSRDGSLQEFVESFEEKKREELLAALREVVHAEPQRDESGDRLTWPRGEGQRAVRMQRIDGRWYLRN